MSKPLDRDHLHPDLKDDGESCGLRIMRKHFREDMFNGPVECMGQSCTGEKPCCSWKTKNKGTKIKRGKKAEPSS